MRMMHVGEGALADMILTAAASDTLCDLHQHLSWETVPDEAGGIAICTGEEIEETAAALSLKGFDVAVPGWFVADASMMERLDALFLKQKRKLLPLFFDRYTANSRDTARLLKEGCLGRIGILDLLKSWPTPGRDALYPLAEGLDLAIDWLGFPIYAKGFRAARESVQCAALTARFEGGELLNMQAVCGRIGEGWNLAYEFSGSLGNLCHDAAQEQSVRLRLAADSGPAERYPLVGTGVCPITAALRDLPSIVKAQPEGLSEAGKRMSAIMSRAFMKDGAYDA